MSSRGTVLAQLALTFALFMPAFATAQQLRSPADMAEAQNSVEVEVAADPGSEWLVEVDGHRVARILVDESGVASRTVWLGTLNEPSTVRVISGDGTRVFERMVVPVGWEPSADDDIIRPGPVEATPPETAPAPVLSGNSQAKRILLSIAAPFVGWFFGYFLTQPIVEPLGFRDGRPTVSGGPRRTVQFVVATGILTGVAASNFIVSTFVLDGDFLFPVVVPAVGIATATFFAFGLQLSDETLDWAMMATAYGTAILSGFAIYHSVPGLHGPGFLQFGAAPTTDGALLTIGGSF